MRSALVHTNIGALALSLLHRFRQSIPVLKIESYLVAADRQTNGPHASTQTFLDARYGIVHFDAGGYG